MKHQIEKKIQSDFSALKWACRRGMLELDVLLGNFLDEAYPRLSLEEQKQFKKLLSFPDPSLFAWLTGQEFPISSFSEIVQAIRHHAISRHQI